MSAEDLSRSYIDQNAGDFLKQAVREGTKTSRRIYIRSCGMKRSWCSLETDKVPRRGQKRRYEMKKMPNITGKTSQVKYLLCRLDQDRESDGSNFLELRYKNTGCFWTSGIKHEKKIRRPFLNVPSSCHVANTSKLHRESVFV